MRGLVGAGGQAPAGITGHGLVEFTGTLPHHRFKLRYAFVFFWRWQLSCKAGSAAQHSCPQVVCHSQVVKPLSDRFDRRSYPSVNSVCKMTRLEYLVFQTFWQDNSQLASRLWGNPLSTQYSFVIYTQSLFQVEVLDHMGMVELSSENTYLWPISSFYEIVDLS